MKTAHFRAYWNPLMISPFWSNCKFSLWLVLLSYQSMLCNSLSASHTLSLELHQPTFWSILQKFASIPHNSILRTFLFNDRYLMCLGVVTDMVLGFSSYAHMISWLVGFYLWPKLVTSRQQQEQHFCKADLLAWFLPIGKFVKVLWQAVSLSIRFLWISLQTYLWSIDLSGYKLRLFKLSCCWDD